MFRSATRSIIPAVAILLTASAAYVLGAASAAPREKTLAEVKDFTDRFNKVYESNDLKAYWEFYADDMTQYWEEGRLDIADYKTYWEKQTADGTRILEVKTAEPAFHVSPLNDAAVAAYRIYTKMRRPDGSIVASWHQETDVLFKRNGRWQVVHLHDSPAPTGTQDK
jgi:ketosteroid isomerase-like protein